MITLSVVLMLAASPARPVGLDRLTTAERALAIEDDDNKKVAGVIDALERCLPKAKDPGSCGADTNCGNLGPPACTYVEYEAWDAYVRHYLALLKVDPKVRSTADEAQQLWEKSQAADCALSDAITDRRELPYRSYYSNQCLLEKTSSRALELRDHVISLYGDAATQGGIPYPGKPPVTVPE